MLRTTQYARSSSRTAVTPTTMAQTRPASSRLVPVRRCQPVSTATHSRSSADKVTCDNLAAAEVRSIDAPRGEVISHDTSSAAPLGVQAGQSDDLDERVRFEASAADQRPVDLGLGDECAEILAGHTAAVLHLEAFANRWSTDLGNRAPNQATHRIGVFGGRSAAGADRPDWLVRHHDRGQMVDGLERAAHLAGNNRLRLAPFLLLQGLADAHNGHQRIFDGRLHFAVDQRVVFVKIPAALGVAEDYVGRQAFEHDRRDLAGEGALWLGVHVLRTDGDIDPAQTVRDGRQRHERRTHNALDCRIELESRQQLVNQRQTLGDGRVHLPIAGNDRLADGHAQSLFKAATPGRTLPSMNSSEAPPPVETWLSLSARPACSTAWTDSPPPTTVVALEPAIAWATPSVPAAKRGSSNTPMGPFQSTVPALSISALKAALLRGPMSTI